MLQKAMFVIYSLLGSGLLIALPVQAQQHVSTSANHMLENYRQKLGALTTPYDSASTHADMAFVVKMQGHYE